MCKVQSVFVVFFRKTFRTVHITDPLPIFPLSRFMSTNQLFDGSHQMIFGNTVKLLRKVDKFMLEKILPPYYRKKQVVVFIQTLLYCSYCIIQLFFI